MPSVESINFFQFSFQLIPCVSGIVTFTNKEIEPHLCFPVCIFHFIRVTNPCTLCTTILNDGSPMRAKDKVSRIQSSPLNQNKFQNNSGVKIHRSLHIKLVDIYEKIHVANKQINNNVFIIKMNSSINLLSGGKTIALIVGYLLFRYLG